MSTTEAENKEIARKIAEEVVTEGNLDLVDEIVAEDYFMRTPAVPEGLDGREEYKEILSMTGAAFSDIEDKVLDVIAEDDKVVQRRRFTGIHDGEFRGIEATGEEIEWEFIVIFRFEDGKIVEGWAQFDVRDFMQQLGVFPPGPRMILRMVAGKLKTRLPGGFTRNFRVD